MLFGRGPEDTPEPITPPNGEESITNFEECVALYPVLESHPRQCNTPGGKHFVEDIGNEIEKSDLIRVISPRPNDILTSPFAVEGEARGVWFFEASFPIRLYDGEGNEITVTVAQAQDDWMTEEFVPFRATLQFIPPATKTGMLIFEKDNPSGLSEHSDELRMPIRFE